MSAQLAPRDRKRILDRLYQEKKGHWMTFIDSLTECNKVTGDSILNAFKTGDALPFLEACERAMREYLQENEMDELEREELSIRAVDRGN